MLARRMNAKREGEVHVVGRPGTTQYSLAAFTVRRPVARRQSNDKAAFGTSR
jgi:hypothetical protein